MLRNPGRTCIGASFGSLLFWARRLPDRAHCIQSTNRRSGTALPIDGVPNVVALLVSSGAGAGTVDPLVDGRGVSVGVSAGIAGAGVAASE